MYRAMSREAVRGMGVYGYTVGQSLRHHLSKTTKLKPIVCVVYRKQQCSSDSLKNESTTQRSASRQAGQRIKVKDSQRSVSNSNITRNNESDTNSNANRIQTPRRDNGSMESRCFNDGPPPCSACQFLPTIGDPLSNNNKFCLRWRSELIRILQGQRKSRT